MKSQLDVKAAKRAILDGMLVCALLYSLWIISGMSFSFLFTFLFVVNRDLICCFLYNKGFRRTDETLIQESAAGIVKLLSTQ